MARKASSPTNADDFREEPGAIVVDEKGEVRGTVRLSLSVLTEMVELTVQDTPGVAGVQGKGRVAGFLPHGSTENFEDAIPVKEREHGGIKVRVKGKHLDADVTVLATGEVNIPELGRTIQAKVSTAAERMLGMSIGTINVHVAGIQPASTDSTN